MKLRSVIAAGVLLSACSDPLVFLQTPRRKDTRSMVFALHTGNGSLEVHAVDATDDALELSFERELEPLLIEALLYDRELDALGLEEGVLVPHDDYQLLSSSGRVSLTGTIDGGGFSGWAEADAPSGALAGLALSAPQSRCPRFTVTSRSIDSNSDIAFAFPIADDAALVGTQGGVIVLVTRAAIEPVRIPAGLPTTTAFIDEEEMIWFAGYGPLWRGRFDRDALEIIAAPTSTVTVSYDARFIDGRASGDSAEIYLLELTGELLRWNGAGVEVLHRFLPQSERGGVVMLRPGEALAALATEPHVVHVQGSTVYDDSPPGLESGVIVLARAGASVFVGTSALGNVFQRDAGGWRVLDGSPIQIDVTAFGASGDDVFEGGALGLIAAYRDGAWCPEQQVGAGTVRVIIPFGDALLIAENPPRREDLASVVILDEQ